MIKHQKDAAQQSAIEADYSARVAERERTRAQSEAELARISANEAKKQKHIADSLKGLATDSANYARAQKDSADIQKGIALNQKSLAENNKIEADKQRKIATRQNILTAPNEYARLIREVPTEATKISKDTFDYKLIAYCNHLDNLESLTKALDNNNMPLKATILLKRNCITIMTCTKSYILLLKNITRERLLPGLVQTPMMKS